MQKISEKKTWVDELIELKNKTGVLCKAEDVVEFAKNPDTDLHSKFEWDDSEAANQYRIYQARNLMRVAVYYEPSMKKEIPVFVSLGQDRAKEGGGYRTLVDVMDKKKLRAEMLAEARDIFLFYRRKYAYLTELSKLFEVIDKI